MLQNSKLVASRNAWRSKATQRTETIKALNKAQKRHKAKIRELKAELKRSTVEPVQKKVTPAQ